MRGPECRETFRIDSVYFRTLIMINFLEEVRNEIFQIVDAIAEGRNQDLENLEPIVEVLS
jgi:hypothetical protein